MTQGQPTPSSQQIQDQNRYNVYWKENSSDEWELAPYLICSRLTDSKGLSTSVATLDVIRAGDGTPGIADPAFYLVSGVSTYGIYLGDGDTPIFKTKFIRVTEDTQDAEETKFIGCIVDVDYIDGSLTKNGITAFGVDWMLDQQYLIGGYCQCTDDGGLDVEKHVANHWGVFNPGGFGNMSLDDFDIESGGENIHIFDYTNLKYTAQDGEDFDLSRWTVAEILDYCIYQLKFNQPQGSEDSAPVDIYGWFLDLFNDFLIIPPPDFPLDTDAQYLNDKQLSGQSVWSLMVDIVEASGDYSLTIEYANDKAKIVIT